MSTLDVFLVWLITTVGISIIGALMVNIYSEDRREKLDKLIK